MEDETETEDVTHGSVGKPTGSELPPDRKPSGERGRDEEGGVWGTIEPERTKGWGERG